MEDKRLRRLLIDVQKGTIDVNTCMKQLQTLPYEDLGWVCLDHHRRSRDILPEVVYGQGKTSDQLVEIIRLMVAAGGPLLVTRVGSEAAESVLRRFTNFHPEVALRYAPEARVLYLEPDDEDHSSKPMTRGYILVVTAGTADIPVAEEACITLRLAGHEYRRLYDVGVAGVHRLLSRLDELSLATVIIVVAGMDGALPSVIGGLVSVPVIAVPVSTGYGASFGGLAPLLTMLNSCATGVSVVNIDNGFGAAAVAAMINMDRRR